MVNGVDENGETQDVGEEDEFLAHVGADLAYFGQEAEAGHPFVAAETSFAGEVVEVCDEALKHVFHALVFAERIDRDHILGDVVNR